MRRLSILLLLASTLGCPGDKRLRAGDTSHAAVPIDTTPADLSDVKTSLPPPAPDTFKPRPVRRSAAGDVGASPDLPPAPPALVSAVRREQTFSKFCYQEFGQKADPMLAGGVAMVVTVGTQGVVDARVANDSWSSHAGAEVNRCLNEKARTAWKLEPGAVPAGKYVVQLSFRGT